MFRDKTWSFLTDIPKIKITMKLRNSFPLRLH